MTVHNSAASVLAAIRSGYPDGVINAEDYVALIAMMREQLAIDEVVGIATELVVRGTNPLAGLDLRDAVAALHIDKLPLPDIERVRRHLQPK